MAQTRIFLDSNSYFRLAKSAHPLLGQEFGGDTRETFLPHTEEHHGEQIIVGAKTGC